jgi:hypothetical protein
MRSAARLALAVSLAVWMAIAAPAASGQEGTAGDGSDARPAGSAAPALDLDKLLKPREGGSQPAGAPRPGGKDRETWQRDFDEAYTEVRQLRSRVDESQRKLRDAAGGSSYSYSPAGGGETYDPEVLKMRAQIQRDRQSLQAAERRLRDLKVEASLAGVPAEWQGTSAEPAPTGD